MPPTFNPYQAPDPEDFIAYFKVDVFNFLAKKIVKNPKQVDIGDLSMDFLSHFVMNEMLGKYDPDYNAARAVKQAHLVQDLQEEYQILRDRNNQTEQDKKSLKKLRTRLKTQEKKLTNYQASIGRKVRFKTFLFWCLRSYWWWNVVKSVSIYPDENNVMREHIKTTPAPLIISQATGDDLDYKYSDVSNSLFKAAEEEKYRRESEQKAATIYLEMFESFLRKIDRAFAMALSLLRTGMAMDEVAVRIDESSELLLTKLQEYGRDFEKYYDYEKVFQFLYPY